MNRWGLQRLRLRSRIFLSFLIVIGLTLSLVVVYGNVAQYNEAENFPLFIGQLYGARFAPFFISSHETNGNWNQADELVRLLVNNPAVDVLPEGERGPLGLIEFQFFFQIDRVVLFDRNGDILADSHPDQALGQDSVETMIPLVTQSGAQIGSLSVLSGFNDEFVDAFQRGSRRVVLTMTLWAALASSLVSLALSYRLTKPIQKLSEAATALAESGEAEMIPVTRNDEVGELTEIFNDMATRLKEQRHLRQQMTADIAHELRTPLSIMRLELNGIADGLQDPAAAVISLEQEINALERLIEDLNLLALTDAQELKLDLREVDAVDFLIQAKRVWDQPTEQHEMRIKLDLPIQEEVLIEADERRLYQILNNLVSNALRYASTSPTLEIGLHLPNHETVQFSVRDYGPGIPQEDIPHLFDRFYRVKGKRAADTVGTGLGLAIAKRLVELHNGRIWCESKLGEGSAFIIKLKHTA
ncbi:MAG: ATP-binding protein [Chloroflexota bacterium]